MDSPDIYDDIGNKVLKINLRNRYFPTWSEFIKYIVNEIDKMRPVKTGLLIFDHLIPRQEIVYKICASRRRD